MTDITKHKDWQKWGLIAQNSSLGTVERHTVLELAFREVAPLILVAGREAAQAEIIALEQRLADAQDDVGELRSQIYYLERGDSLSPFARIKRLIVRG